MRTGIEHLRWLYPWPGGRPFGEPREEGLLDHETQLALREHLPPNGPIVVELGSYLGFSAKYLLDIGASEVICVDHWNGFPGWNLRRRMLPHYHQFCLNVWSVRDRIIPVREKTVAGLAMIHERGVWPDLIWIDAGHDEQSVYEDVSVSCELFPGINLIGHDWNNRPGVRAGVERAIKEGLTAELPEFRNGTNWWSLTQGAQA